MSDFLADILEAQNTLCHHGILGQKWGVRRYQNKDGSLTAEGTARYSKNKGADSAYNYGRLSTIHGEKTDLIAEKDSVIVKALRKLSPKFREENDKLYDYTITDKQGRKIGTTTVNMDKPDELNLMWINIDSRNRGKGYAQDVLNTTINTFKEQGVKKFTLEVPGNSPDALHIYKKFGFKETKKLSDDDVWGGLTSMELKIK